MQQDTLISFIHNALEIRSLLLTWMMTTSFYLISRCVPHFRLYFFFHMQLKNLKTRVHIFRVLYDIDRQQWLTNMRKIHLFLFYIVEIVNFCCSTKQKSKHYFTLLFSIIASYCECNKNAFYLIECTRFKQL